MHIHQVKKMKVNPKNKYGLKEFYKFYKDKYSSKVNYKTYSAIIREFYADLSELMINEGIELSMPERLGEIRIIKYKTKLRIYKGELDKRNLVPDWKSTKELWAKIYPTLSWEEIVAIPNKSIIFHENKHTGGYKFKWAWHRFTCTIKNNKSYVFKSTRNNNRSLAKALKDPKLNLDYYTTHLNNK